MLVNKVDWLILVKREKIILHIVIHSTFQTPIISIPRDKNPSPCTLPWNCLTLNKNNEPAIPANIEESKTIIHWYLTTLIPCESTA